DRATGVVGAHNIGVDVRAVDDQTLTVSNDVGAGSTFGNRFNFTWKTPTLIGLAKRAPYFHGGQAASLRDVIEQHDRPPQSRGVETRTLGLSVREESGV